MELARRDGERWVGSGIGDQIDSKRAEDQHVPTIIREGEVRLVLTDRSELCEVSGGEVVAPDVLGPVEAERDGGDLRQELAGGEDDGFPVGGESGDTEGSGLPRSFRVKNGL